MGEKITTRYQAINLSTLTQRRGKLAVTGSARVTRGAATRLIYNVDNSNYQNPLEMEPTGCSEMLVTNYKTTVYNNPEERRSYLHRGGRLNSRKLSLTIKTANVNMREQNSCHETQQLLET